MRYKGVMAILAGFVISSNAAADSFCGFDQGLIGTKAIGFVAPASLEAHKYETGLCELNVFDAASDSVSSRIHPCTDFQHVPSAYIDNYESEGFDPVGSDYFLLQAFDAIDLWGQISLKSGEKKWTKLKHQNPYGFPYQYKADKTFEFHEHHHHPTQGSIFLEPRLDKPAGYMGQYFRGITNDWIDQKVSADFFNHDLFKVLEKYGLFDPDHIEQGKIATHYESFLNVGYHVKSIVKDDDGREWLETEEFLKISPHEFWALVETKFAEQGITPTKEDGTALFQSDLFSLRSAGGRTIYFPYREPSGTITMVMTDGPDCD